MQKFDVARKILKFYMFMLFTGLFVIFGVGLFWGSGFPLGFGVAAGLLVEFMLVLVYGEFKLRGKKA